MSASGTVIDDASSQPAHEILTGRCSSTASTCRHRKHHHHHQRVEDDSRCAPSQLFSISEEDTDDAAADIRNDADTAIIIPNLLSTIASTDMPPIDRSLVERLFALFHSGKLQLWMIDAVEHHLFNCEPTRYRLRPTVAHTLRLQVSVFRSVYRLAHNRSHYNARMIYLSSPSESSS